MLLEMPGTGGTIDASPEHAEVLKAAGWKVPKEPEGAKKKEAAPKRRSTRRPKE